MNSSNLRIVLLVFLSLSFYGAYAQSSGQTLRQDFGIWSTLEAKMKLNKKWDLSAELAHRRRDNAYQLKSQFVEIKLTRDLRKKWKTSFYVRPVQTQDEFRLRFSHAFSKSKKVKKLSIKYRLKHDLEHSFSDEISEWELTMRNRLGLQYKIKKSNFKPAVYVEINNDYEKQFMLLDRVRYKAVLDYELNKKFNLGLSYIIQQQYNTKNPRRDFVVAIGLTYDI